ncbi:cytochrome C biogenesis protein CcmF [Caulobacter sp. Root1455]|uniref:heme lyase CcmF/NrfE family subunit n=1 Tax=Caulobacter sp. Root1455 TaxID=1736465 RepID=UPI0007005BBC|nr:heme lyase CcmF/NrfE family subunit [Caulobacter sp. Root1455]KQY93834.1 cytochrome C biogenesis protein CcmF [Caulobacter sp. Root1455]
MITEFGAYALVLALVLSALQLSLSAIGGARRSALLAGAGRGAALGAFLCTALTFLALVHAFVMSDFSVANVAANSHTAKPMLYKVAGAWGSHEGSMLLWCLVLTGYGAAVASFGEALPPRLRAYAVATQGALGVLFLAYTVFASNPMTRLLDVPVEGASLNPLLQDPALAFHPPFLYCGYVGFSVVFSFAMAALIEGRVDAAWARWVRPWTLAAWSFLTIGITLGAFWAYYELGWGGWWFWDPVENASFMPWLIGSALLHSAVVLEKRGALPGWTVFLGLAAFTFSMLGAFLVRSGVLTSVHAFAVDPTRGILLLTIMGVAAGAGFLLFALRAPSLNAGGLFAPVSRESAIVLNNIILSTATAVVLVGTLFPLIREAMDGEAVSVGAPFFNMTFVPLMVLAMAVLPAGPLLAWKRGDARLVVRRLWLALALAAILGLVAFAVVAPRSGLASAGLVVGFWLIGGAVLELAERIKAFRAPWAEVRRRATGLPRGAWGTTLAHAGLGIFVLGASFETTWRVEAAQALSVGGQLKLGAYELVLTDVGTVEGSNYIAERGTVRITRDGAPVCEAKPERRFYPAGRQTTSEVAICPKVLDDLYVVLGERRAGENGQPAWLVRAFVNPWVRLIFLGPLVMAIGGLVSLSDRRLRFGVAKRAETAA